MIESSCKIENPYLTTPKFFKYVQFVDDDSLDSLVNRGSWVNNDKTLVFKLPKGWNLYDDVCIELLEFVGNSRCDSFTVRNFEGEYIVRMYTKWWAAY